MSNCFIIMPITTPDGMLEVYRDGKDHFKHVLDSLFIPAVEKAGFTAQPPKAKGSDLIQADIISKLEEADIVLCDMTCLNPNVFFEFGIRTSLNKPVCVVRDDLTKIIPFDTGMLNREEYKSSLDGWELDKEIEKLAEHIKVSSERSKGQNTLWKYLGIKTEAAPYKDEAGSDTKYEYLISQIEALRKEIQHSKASNIFNFGDKPWLDHSDRENKFIEKLIQIGGTNIHRVDANKDGIFDVIIYKETPEPLKNEIKHFLIESNKPHRIFYR